MGGGGRGDTGSGLCGGREMTAEDAIAVITKNGGTPKVSHSGYTVAQYCQCGFSNDPMPSFGGGVCRYQVCKWCGGHLNDAAGRYKIVKEKDLMIGRTFEFLRYLEDDEK